MNDAYATLGVTASASTEEVKGAYRRLVRQYHPDLHLEADGTIPVAVYERFAALTEAYERVLSQVEPAYAYAPPKSGTWGSSPRVRQRSREPMAGMMPQQRGATQPRELDPLRVLLTLPQGLAADAWTASALEVWALALVPEARRHLDEARSLAVAAGPIAGSDEALATAHALITLSLRKLSARKFAVLAPCLDLAYSHLEERLPATVRSGLPGRALRGRRVSVLL